MWEESHCVVQAILELEVPLLQTQSEEYRYAPQHVTFPTIRSLAQAGVLIDLKSRKTRILLHRFIPTSTIGTE